MTRADMIRQMDDEDLVEFLLAVRNDEVRFEATDCNQCSQTEFDCIDCFREWVLGGI